MMSIQLLATKAGSFCSIRKTDAFGSPINVNINIYIYISSNEKST